MRSRARSTSRSYLPDGALLRHVQRERTVALSGGRALFMQAAHPVAFSGFFAATTAHENPFPRLARTALAINTVIYGSEAQATEVQEIVGAMHARVKGRMTENVGDYRAGTPYRGDDPELLRWILAAFIDSSYRTYERYVRGLDDAQRDELWTQWRMVGAIFGLEGDAMPRSYAEHLDYLDGMLTSGALVVSKRARAVARDVILNPPLPTALLPVRELVNHITIDSLPGDLRQQFGFLPVPGRGLAARGFAQWMRLIGTPISPESVRHVPARVMPAPGRSYADLAAYVDAQFAATRG